MAPTKTQILELLSDGIFHSGTDLGRCLGISRAAVHKHIAALSEQGVAIRRVPGRGYKLASGIRLLDAGHIEALLEAPASPVMVEVVEEISSTNRQVIQNPPPPGVAKVCVAEIQHTGRGRRGRSWVASPYRNLMLSLAWNFPSWPETVTMLSLSAAVAAARAVERVTPGPLGLKWPNDLMWGDRKLGGLLIELEGESGGRCLAVLGLGVNVEVSAADGAAIDQPWTDLLSVTGDAVDRNVLAAACIEEFSAMLVRFPESGFGDDRVQWNRRDSLLGRPVRVETETGAVQGEARGVDEFGRLVVVDDRGGVRHLISGEVSVRRLHAAR